jgi:PAS domain S-box-containing protein
MATGSIAQLIAFQAAVSSFTDEPGAVRRAVEQAMEMLDADFGAIADARGVAVAVGFARGQTPEEELLAACDGRPTLALDYLGLFNMALAHVWGEPACQLLLGRKSAPFDASEQTLIGGMGSMLSETLRVVRLIQRERGLYEDRERQNAENVSLQRFRSAFEEVDSGMAIVGAGGTFLRVNRKLADVLGHSPQELVGLRYHDLLDCDERADSERTFADVLDSGSPGAAIEQRVRHAAGHWIWLDLTASQAAGQLVIQAQDITKRKRAEAALRESEDRYRSLVEHLPLIVYRNALDAPGTDLYVSPQVEELLGYPISTWKSGYDFFSHVVHPDDRQRVYARLAEVITTGEGFSCEYRVCAADGSTLTVRQEGTVLTDERGVPLCVQGYIIDTSEQRRLEQQLRLSQKLEAVGQLAAGVAHEINTPIQFVGSSADFAAEAVTDLFELVDVYRSVIAGSGDEAAIARAGEAEETADLEYLQERTPAAFDRMRDGIGRVASIVGAMRDFTHPRTGTHTHVDVNAALESTLVVAHAQYRYVADVETDLRPLPVIMGDGGELNQVFVNLVVNAAHAIEDVVGSSGDRGTIRVATHQDGDDVVIAVSDSGCGIPDGNRERIFDPYFTTKDVGRGTGQGLAITRSIVADRHCGSIVVDSVPGQGSTFEIRLPIGGTAEDRTPLMAA